MRPTFSQETYWRRSDCSRSAWETADDKLLQIVLVGQPELDDKLDSLGLRQLKQRIALRAQLAPLDSSETVTYIEKRLQIAGADLPSAPIFPRRGCGGFVFQHSHNLPRLINTICENALIAAYARQSHSVTPEIIQDVAREFRLDVTPSRDGEGTGKTSEKDLRQAANAMLDIFASLQKSEANSSSSESAAGTKQGKHELHI